MRVFSVGPTARQSGGIAAVVAELERCSAAVGSVDLTVVDSGGVGGRRRSRCLRFVMCLLKVVALRPDVAHLHVASRGSTWRKVLVAGVCDLVRVPYGIHLHGASYQDFIDNEPRWRRDLVSRFFLRAIYVVALGSYWARMVIHDIGVPAERVVVVPNGVAEPRVSRCIDLEAPVKVLFLGRMERLKGVPELVAAWEEVSQPGCVLQLAGPESEPDVVELVRKCYAVDGSSVEYLGLVTRAEALRLMSSASIFVLPSHAEGLPMALIEAMALAVPCVATRVGAVDELVLDGETGFIISPGDSRALADSLTELLKSSGLRTKFGDAGQLRWREGFTADAMYGRLERLWLDYCGAGR